MSASSRPGTLKTTSWQKALGPDILGMERTRECFEKIEMDIRLDYRLPRKESLAGSIVKHCFHMVDLMIEKHEPLIFKVGYTHCAHMRFYNSKFGYVHEQAAWEHMLVLYAAGETISPAFIEAALIQHYKGDWDQNKSFFIAGQKCRY